MPTWVLRNGEFVEKHLAPPLITTHGDAPYVISDTMSETRHMANGQYYTSKSEFRKATKAHGCVEIGDDSSLTQPRKPVLLDRQKRVRDIKDAIDQVRSRSSRRRKRR